MSSEIHAILRRIKPEKRRGPLVPRRVSELPFLDHLEKFPTKLLYDTTVYIDILQGTFPRDGQFVLRAAEAWHSSICGAELATPCGFLDPHDSRTSSAVKQIVATIEAQPVHRTLTPDPEIWLEAAILSGLLSRLQSYPAIERRRLLNDALLFSTARKHGLTVLTRNSRDFDLLQQIEPLGRVLFYSRN